MKLYAALILCAPCASAFGLERFSVDGNKLTLPDDAGDVQRATAIAFLDKPPACAHAKPETALRDRQDEELFDRLEAIAERRRVARLLAGASLTVKQTPNGGPASPATDQGVPPVPAPASPPPSPPASSPAPSTPIGADGTTV